MAKPDLVPRPEPLELVANLLLGVHDELRALPAAEGIGVHAALERAMLPALRRPPCLVSFSGGRDSSAILAVATDVARRHGLPAPVPATMRFPSAPTSHESEWQQLVLRHLGVDRAEVVELGHELDLLGPQATSVLLRDGVRWPSNAYMHLPLLELGRGGSLLTGAGGDELLGTRASRHVFLLRRRARPGRGDLRALAAGAAPRRLRAAVWLRRNHPSWPWLTDRGARELGRALAREEVSWPHRWDASMHHWYRSRAFVALDRALEDVAPRLDVAVVNPFLVPEVMAELAALGGPTGFPGRTQAMRRLFGHLLPEPVLSRTTKAEFTGALWGPSVRAFAADWAGEGVDRELVDPDALRHQWMSERPDFRTALLLQEVWLAGQGKAAIS